jgi:hypothetical protein
MKFSILFFSCFILAGSLAWGQPGSGDDLLKRLSGDSDHDQVQIQSDSLLDVNYYKLMAVNSKVRGVPGYRIRIFSESGIRAREQLQHERVRFHTCFPEIDTYDNYDGVYFKLYVGDCRTRSEALKLYDLIEDEFPNPIIREDYIKIK